MIPVRSQRGHNRMSSDVYNYIHIIVIFRNIHILINFYRFPIHSHRISPCVVVFFAELIIILSISIKQTVWYNIHWSIIIIIPWYLLIILQSSVKSINKHSSPNQPPLASQAKAPPAGTAGTRWTAGTRFLGASQALHGVDSAWLKFLQETIGKPGFYGFTHWTLAFWCRWPLILVGWLRE